MKIFAPIFLTLLLSKTSIGQSDFKQKGALSFNIVTGYQSLFKTADIDEKLVTNNFSKLSTPGFSVGFEWAGFDHKTILKTHLLTTGIFVNENVKEATLQTITLALQYGKDLLKKKEKTFLYPFVGFRMFDHGLIGQSTDGKKLKTRKVNFDFLTGIGLKQFLNSTLRGIFNNIDLNIGASLPVINGKWKKEGSEFVSGTYKLKPTYYFTFSIGRGFRPAYKR